MDEESESGARRAALKVGFPQKSRWRRDSMDNRGGFMLIEPNRNAIVAGEKFDLGASDVVRFCPERRKASDLTGRSFTAPPHFLPELRQHGPEFEVQRQPIPRSLRHLRAVRRACVEHRPSIMTPT